ncbi:MAG: phytoene synthase, partial [Tabrizicola sp.]
LERLAEARKARKTVPGGIRPALLAGWQAEGVLRQAVAGRSSLDLPEAQRRGRLIWQAFTGRW